MMHRTERADDDVAHYAEHDKLGPFGGTRAVFDDAAELRRVLVAEFREAASAARIAAASVDRNATKAVHTYRKALRRARAVLSLVARALPRSERRAVRRALRDARRALGSARDHAVAPDSVGLVRLDDISQHVADAILTTAREAVPPLPEIKQLLHEGAARAAAQVEALEAALPPTLAWSTVVRGIRDVYAEARAARKAARRSKRAFHTWRRRTKELAYQIDVLARYAGDGLAELQHELDDVTDTQSPVVDLIMLRDFVRTHGAGTSAEALETVTDAIREQIDDAMADSRRAGRELFRRRPGRFARRVTKAVRRNPARVDELPADGD